MHLSLVMAATKNMQEILAEKESELARVRKELAALRIVAPLLDEEEDCIGETTERMTNIPMIRQLLAQDETVIDSPHASSSGRGRWRE